MKTFALQILCCISIGILGLHAATKILAPVQVSQAVIPDGRGNTYWIFSGGAKGDALYVVLPINAKHSVYLPVMGNATQAQILKELKARGLRY